MHCRDPIRWRRRRGLPHSHGNQNGSAEETAGSSRRSEGADENLFDSCRNLIGKDDQEGNRRNDVDNGHGRNDFRSYAGDGLQAADGNGCNQDGQDDSRVFDGNARRQPRDFDDGVNLSKGTDTEESDEDAEESKQECQGLYFLPNPFSM